MRRRIDKLMQQEWFRRSTFTPPPSSVSALPTPAKRQSQKLSHGSNGDLHSIHAHHATSRSDGGVLRRIFEQNRISVVDVRIDFMLHAELGNDFQAAARAGNRQVSHAGCRQTSDAAGLQLAF